MKAFGIGEVFVKVQDMDRAIGFYRDLLGFEVDRTSDHQAYIRLATGHLVLKQAGSPGHDAGGPMHFAFVTSPETIDELAERFKGTPYKTRGPLTFEGPMGARCFFIFDPDGNEVEFNDLYYPFFRDDDA